MAVTRVIDTEFQIFGYGEEDTDNFTIKVKIDKGPTALSGVTEEQVMLFVMRYLQSLTTNPIDIRKTQVIQTDGY
jgi:hypothetical protein